MDEVKTPGASIEPHPVSRGQHLKRVSLLIHSKKYPNQDYIGYALLHEFDPKRLSFFSSQKFPVDDELVIDVDYFGQKAHFKVLVTGIHEQISSGRVMNAIPSEDNPSTVRKFYRSYGSVSGLEGLLPGMTDANSSTAATGAPALAAVPEADGSTPTPAPAANADGTAPAAEGAPSGPSLVAAPDAPSDSADMKAKLDALSAPAADEKQAA